MAQKRSFLKVLNEKTFKILKGKHLLACHLCRLQLVVGDFVVFSVGAGRKKYHKACADRLGIIYSSE